MTQIEKFDHSNLPAFRERIQAALKDVGLEFGVAVEVRGGSFSGEQYKPRITFNTVAADGTVYSQEADDWKYNACHHGFSEDDLGRRFVNNGQSYKIVGWLRKSKKYSVLCQRPDGVKTKFTVEGVKRGLEVFPVNG